MISGSLFICRPPSKHTCRNLLKNPPPNPQDLEMLKKATTDGIKLPGSEAVTTLPASLVEEAIIVSELFKVSECATRVCTESQPQQGNISVE